MKRFVFEFTNEENDRATEEFYLLKNVETAKSDCKTLCCVFAMMPLLLVFLYIIGSFREEDLGVILGLCVVVIIVGAATIFRLMYFGGAVPLGEIYNKEVRPSEEFQKSKNQLIFEGDVCRFVAGLEIGTMKCEKFSKVLESDVVFVLQKGRALTGESYTVVPKEKITEGTLGDFREYLNERLIGHRKIRYYEVPIRWRKRMNADREKLLEKLNK